MYTINAFVYHVHVVWFDCFIRICDWILKTYPLGTSKRLKILTIFSQNWVFWNIWIKQLLSCLAVKFHTKSFFLLGGMGDYIRLTKCAQKVGFPRSGHIIMFMINLLNWLSDACSTDSNRLDIGLQTLTCLLNTTV